MADKRDKRDYQQEGPQQGHPVLGAALAIGSIIGAGALGWRFRRQIGTGFRATGDFVGTIASMGSLSLARSSKLKGTIEDVKTFAASLNHAMDNRTIFSHMANPSRFEDRFNQKLQQSIESRARGNGIPFGTEDLSLETQLEELRIQSRKIPRKTLEDQRTQYIEQELKQKHSWIDFEKDFGSHLTTYGHKWMHGRNLSTDSTRAFVDHVIANNAALQQKMNVAKVGKDEFTNSLYETLDRYRNLHAKGFNESGRRQLYIDTVKKNYHHLWEGLIAKNKQSRNAFVERVMANNGYRPVTVDEMANHKNSVTGKEENLFKDRKRPKPNQSRDGEPHIDTRLASKMSQWMKMDKRFAELVVDNNVWINARGEFLDNRWMARTAMNFADTFRRTVQIPYLRFNPLDLLHFSTYEGVRDAPKIAFRNMGTIDPALHGSVKEYAHPLAHNQDAAVGVLARNYMQTSDGKLVDLTTGDIVKHDVYQASGRFGMVPRALSGMANLHAQEYNYSKGFLGFMQKTFDFGKQETESAGKRALSALTKFWNPEWGQNLHKSLRDGVLDKEDVYKLMFAQMESKSSALSDDTIYYINHHISKAYGNLGINLNDLDTPEKTMEALGKINRGLLTKNSDVAKVSSKADGSLEGLDRFINDTWRKYASDKQAFMRNKRIVPNNAIYLPEWLSALDMHDTEMVDKVDDVRRLIHMHALRQIEHATGDTGKITVASLVQQGIDEGVLGKDSLKQVRDLETLSTMRKWWDDVYKGAPADKEIALTDFKKRVLNENPGFDDPLHFSTMAAMKDFNPWYTMGKGQEPPQYFGFVNNLSMNKAKGARWMLSNYNKTIAEGGDALDGMMSSAKGFFGQFFAGRHNLGNVTTATLFPYYYAERLDNAVSHVGFGLSQKNRGSFQSIMTNQFLRRIVLPYFAIQQLGYVNSMLGKQPTDTLADGYVNMRTDVQQFKEFTGLNDIGRQWSRVFSGGDQISETPIARAFNFLTLGVFSDTRSGEEEQHYWESGEDPIRKGRFWSLGSGTPYTGGKIDRFEPNWYRRTKSDYKFTDTLYGSRSEYYANAWFPTLTHPFAPVRHFLLDPYHWENKHKDDRPYPETGGFSELDSIPLIGTSVDSVTSAILKPHRRDPRLRKAHREYLSELNDNIAAQYNQMQMGGYLQGMPSGGTGLLQDSEVTEAQVSASGGYASAGMYDDGSDGGSDYKGGGGGFGIGDGSYSPYDTGSAKTAGHGVGHGRGRRGATGAVRQQIALVNSAMSDIGGPALGVTGKNIHSVSSLEDLRDPDVIANLHDIDSYYSLKGQARDSFYSATEVGGIYGFMLKGAMGYNDAGRAMTLDNSSRMTSYNRAWWDNELGGMDGLGGGLSEIFRRYVTRDPNKNYWNPIRNRMPYWMPGADYFTDFQHGDPYVKVPHGEMRLPGAAYEKLYKLHPDAFGEYGAFDRYRILADVAPYSQQFKFYKAIVSKMNGANMLSDSEKQEYAEIRDQVSQKKSKYRFYDRQFTKGYSDVNYETVHVTRMLDATTFLTQEHPYNPIRMAAVKIKADDEEAQQWLSQYVHSGATLKIATDKDPLNTVRDDTYGTIRAVVYNRSIGNVNFALANRKEGGFMGMGGTYTASTHNDGTATSNRALFSNDMIAVGKMWEWATHDLLPNLPIVGTIADKFLQVRDPLEMYKRQEVYGKAWKPWEDPIGSWIKPMVETMASHNPVVAAAQGAGIGWLFTKATGKIWGTHVGAIIGGAAATVRVFGEVGHRLATGSDDTWIPKRREQEREINEYFDTLRYMKYHGLYEKTRQEAIKHEGVDVEDLIQGNNQRGKKNKGKRKYLENTKKWLSMAKKLGYGDSGQEDVELGNVRGQLDAINADRPLTKLGPMAMLALRYKDEYESTLYGADENGDMTKIFRALPNKDREFFQKFMNASPSEREEILRLVPKNERRFYQAKWGLKIDKKPTLNEYFSTHYLPGANWSGWRPDVSLENYKVKVIKNEGLELTEFGDWSDDEKRAEQSKADVIPVHSLSANIDVGRIERVLRGAGLDNVKVTMDTTHSKDDNRISLAMNILKDRSNDIIQEINNNMGGIISAGSQVSNGIITRPTASQN